MVYLKITTGSSLGRSRKKEQVDQWPAKADQIAAIKLPGDAAPVTTNGAPVSVSVADALQGIRMPCDLAPLMIGYADPKRVAFQTSGHAAAEVGEQLADELERLGCEITPLDESSIRVVRGDDELEATIHADGASVLAGNERRYPTVANGTVVVELSLH